MTATAASAPPWARCRRGGPTSLVVTDDNPRSEDPAAIRAAVIAGAREAVRTARRATEIIDGGSRSSAIAEAIALAVVATGQAARSTPSWCSARDTRTGQEIHGVMHPFDDRDAVRAALRSARARRGVTP